MTADAAADKRASATSDSDVNDEGLLEPAGEREALENGRGWSAESALRRQLGGESSAAGDEGRRCGSNDVHTLERMLDVATPEPTPRHPERLGVIRGEALHPEASRYLPGSSHVSDVRGVAHPFARSLHNLLPNPSELHEMAVMSAS